MTIPQPVRKTAGGRRKPARKNITSINYVYRQDIAAEWVRPKSANQANATLARDEIDPSNPPKKVVADWLVAQNSRDPQALANLYDRNAENYFIGLGPPVCGRSALWQSFVKFFQAFPDYFIRMEKLYSERDWVLMRWRSGGTFVAPFGKFAATGRTYSVQGSSFFRIIGGKITFHRGYLDHKVWFNQLGIENNSVP